MPPELLAVEEGVVSADQGSVTTHRACWQHKQAASGDHPQVLLTVSGTFLWRMHCQTQGVHVHPLCITPVIL